MEGKGTGGGSAAETTGSGSGSGSGGDYVPEDFAAFSGSKWPSPGEMRIAAMRRGMPEWQSDAIRSLADLSEMLTEKVAPWLEALEELWKQFKEWLKDHRSEVWLSTFGLLMLTLLAAAAIFLRDAPVGLWLRARFDYVRLIKLNRAPRNEHGVRQYYLAMERLFALHDTRRSQTTTAREYLQEMRVYNDTVRLSAAMLTAGFEHWRYGRPPGDQAMLDDVQRHYLVLYKQLA